MCVSWSFFILDDFHRWHKMVHCKRLYIKHSMSLHIKCTVFPFFLADCYCFYCSWWINKQSKLNHCTRSNDVDRSIFIVPKNDSHELQWIYVKQKANDIYQIDDMQIKKVNEHVRKSEKHGKAKETLHNTHLIVVSPTFIQSHSRFLHCICSHPFSFDDWCVCVSIIWFSFNSQWTFDLVLFPFRKGNTKI